LHGHPRRCLVAGHYDIGCRYRLLPVRIATDRVRELDALRGDPEGERARLALGTAASVVDLAGAGQA